METHALAMTAPCGWWIWQNQRALCHTQQLLPLNYSHQMLEQVMQNHPVLFNSLQVKLPLFPPLLGGEDRGELFTCSLLLSLAAIQWDNSISVANRF